MKKRWWALGGVGLLLGTAAFIWFVILRDTTTPVNTEDLGFTGVAGDAPGDPGIYVYDTTGYETIDAMGGARHDYPAVTYLVIQDGDCGPVVRWYAIKERWFEWEHCGPNLGITGTSNFHIWFHVSDLGTTACSAPFFPPAGETSWTTVCDDGETISTDVATLVGTETLVIGGQSVDTIHVRIDSTSTGVSVATTTTDEWRLPGTPLVVRREFHDDSLNDTLVGTVHYVEEVTAQLRSLIPTG